MSFLENYKRQPKLFIDLPSSGEFYSDGVFEDNQFVQIPVFAMTAADEIITKTPDALFSGQAVASILESCIPLINDPWKLIKTDLEYILNAIRLASIGNTIDMSSTCSVCGTENTVEIELQSVLSHYDQIPHKSEFTYKDLIITLRPITFKQMSQLGIELYQKQRTLYQLQSAEMSQDEKVKQATTVSQEVVNLTTKTLVQYIVSVANGSDAEYDNKKINDFINQNDSEISKLFLAEITKFVDIISYPSLQVQCAGELESGENCTNKYSVTYNSDYSSFFGNLL
jgi:hypothetical protein